MWMSSGFDVRDGWTSGGMRCFVFEAVWGEQGALKARESVDRFLLGFSPWFHWCLATFP